MRAVPFKQSHAKRVFFFVATSALFGGCGSAIVQVGIDARGPSCQRDFGVSTAASKIETFLAAVAELDRVSEESDAALRETCTALGHDLGMSEAVLHQALLEDTGTLCSRVTDMLREEQTAASTSGNVILQVGAPTCTWSASEARACISECELRYRPDDVSLTCEISAQGTCSGVLESPQAGPRCRAACGTRIALHATCTEPSAVLEGNLAGADARTLRLATAWAAHGPRIAVLAERTHRLRASTERLLQIAPVLPEAAAVVSIRAVACASAAALLAEQIEVRLASGARVAVTLQGMAH
jgi:hypothetical protein